MGLRIISPPPGAEPDLASSFDEPRARRLPPTASPEPGPDGPALPGISYVRSAAPAAPLPPGPIDTAVRPLPRVN